jgi:hypothetical protein
MKNFREEMDTNWKLHIKMTKCKKLYFVEKNNPSIILDYKE